MRLRLALVPAALALIVGPSASAAPGLLVGVVDNSLMWTHQPAPIVAVQQDLGLRAIRLTAISRSTPPWFSRRRQRPIRARWLT